MAWYALCCAVVHPPLQGLSSLRRLDLSGNMLRRLEVLRPACGLQLLAELDVAANPLEAAHNVRLYMIYLLPQVGRGGGGGGQKFCKGCGQIDCRQNSV
jgi:hypothetical protein